MQRVGVVLTLVGVASLGAAIAGCSGSEPSTLIESRGGANAGGGSDGTSNGGGGDSGGSAQPDAGGGGGPTGGRDAASSKPDSGPINPNDPFAQERQRCFDLSNQIRAIANVPPLVRASAAEESCVDDQAKQEYMLPPETPGFPGRPHGKLYMCSEARQNHYDGTTDQMPGCTGTCANVKLVEEALNSWYYDDAASQNAHKFQMTDPAMTRVACGFYRDASGYLWINADYY